MSEPSGLTQSPEQSRIVGTSRGRVAGTDFHEAVVGLRGELGDPHLMPFPELPERGFAATRTARTIATLEDLSADGQPFGWRLQSHPSKESRAASSRMSNDLNVLADVVGAEGAGHRGHTVVSLTGPVTLAADIRLTNGESVLSDHGARRELAASLCEGLGPLSKALRTAVDGEALTLRWCEPRLTQAMEGRVPTSSGYRTLRALPRAEVRGMMTDLAAASTGQRFATILDVDGPFPDLEFGQHFDAVAARPYGRGASEWEKIAGATDRGQQVCLAVTPIGSRDTTVETVRSFWSTWRDLGLGAKELEKVRIEEREDLSSLSPDQGLKILARNAAIAEALLEQSRE